MNRMRLIFAGCNSAFAIGPDAYHSNMVLQNGRENFLIDCGGDIRHSLYDIGLTYRDITHVYISHLHGDHTYGLEWLGVSSYFDPLAPKPKLFIRDTLVDLLWETVLKGPMSTIKDCESSLSVFFDLHVLKEEEGFSWNGAEFMLVPVVHYYNNTELAPCYGLVLTTDNQKTFISTDTQFTPERLTSYYENSDLILHDCETSNVRTYVHAHYMELKTLPDEIKEKMWLYHYNNGRLPNAPGDGFGGFVKKGQVFEI